MARQATISAILTVSVKQFTTGLERAQKSLNKFANNTSRVGRELSVALSAPLIALGRGAIQVARDFELAQTKIAALRGQNKIIESLARQARDLGENTIFSATAVSELQLSLTRLGSSTDEVQKLTPTVLALSQALDSELAPTGEFLIQTLNKFGRSLESVGDRSDQAKYTANLFAKATAESTLTVEKLESALNFSGAEAANFGFTLAETVSILGVLSRRGFDATRGGTAFRRILQQIAKDGYNARDAIAILFDESKGFRQELEDFGLRGAGPRSALGSVEAQQEQIALQAQLENSAGFIETIQDVIDKTLYAEIEKFNSALRETSLVLADTLMPTIKRFLIRMTELVKSFNESSPATQKFVVAVGGILAALGPALFFISAFARVINLLIKPISFLGKQIIGLTSKFSISSKGAKAAATAFTEAAGSTTAVTKSVKAVGPALTTAGRLFSIFPTKYLRKFITGLSEALSGTNLLLFVITSIPEAVAESIRKSNIDSATKEALLGTENLRSKTGEELEKLKEEYRDLYEQTDYYIDRLGQNLDDILAGDAQFDPAGFDKGVFQFLDDRTKREYIQNVNDKIAALKNLEIALGKLNADSADVPLVEGLLQRLEDTVVEAYGKETPLPVPPEVKRNVDELTQSYQDLAEQIAESVSKLASGDLSVGETDVRNLKELKEEFTKVKDILDEFGVDLSELGIAGSLEDIIKAAVKFGTFGDDTARDFSKINKVSEDLSVSLKNASDAYLAVSEPLDNTQGLQRNIDFLSEQADAYDKAAIAAYSIGAIGLSQEYRDQADAIKEQIKSLNDFITIQTRLVDGITNGINLVTSSFKAARAEGEGFFKSLLTSLLSVFKEIVAKLLTLITLYGILAVISGGTSVLASAASSAMGSGGLGGFVMGGFGLPTKSMNSNPGVRGFVSGHNLVLAGSRGVTATDRIYG